MSEKSNQRRTLQERIEDIFQFIETQETVFPKSRLKEIGLNPKTAEKWLSLIEFIQSQPKIRLISSGHNTLIEKVEGKYQALMRKMMTDESVPFEERLQYSTDYLKSQYSREKLKKSEVQPLYISESSLNSIILAIRILSLLDSHFKKYLQKFNQIASISDNGERLREIQRIKTKLASDHDSRIRIKEILDDPFTRAKVQDIGETDSLVKINFGEWKKAVISLLNNYGI